MIRTRALSLTCLALLSAPVAFAQQAPPPPSPLAGREMNTMKHERGGMGIVPPGTWWKNPTVVTDLALTADQLKKLDDTFLQSRISLVHLHASLEEEQLKLEPLINTNPPDQARALAQISKIADLRAELEKADARMLLSLRGVLTADQWTKLQADQRKHRLVSGQDRGREERRPDAQIGPQGKGRQTRPGMPPPPPNDDQQ
jgi:Spy/CpxP family protein refolding chaperone